MSDSFDRAALAVVDGDLDTLQRLLSAHPGLVREHSADAFRATLLHHVAANGIPDELQRSPANAVEICRCLLTAGAEPDALADSYGGGPNQTPLCLLVSSWHPFAARVQTDLVRALLDGGARVNGLADDGAPLATALVFGYTEAAETLRDCGARADNVFFAAGLGDLDTVRRLLARDDALGTYRSPFGVPLPETPEARAQEALHFAVTHGRIDVAEWLLDNGASVEGEVDGHHCGLPLLQALFVHEIGAAKMLIERGADGDKEDRKRKTTPRRFARDRGMTEVLEVLGD